MTPYSALWRTTEGHGIVEISEKRLHDVLGSAASVVTIDDEWYLSKYPDVAVAIEQGAVKCAKDHYVMYGYFEDRTPREMIVDEEWYLTEYPDVADAIHNGQARSTQQHFEKYGFKEGRRPYDGWTL